MLTLFSTPKPFRGHIKVIQTNAILSWTLLRPKPEIILLGDEEGTQEICKNFSLRHIPQVKRNEYGTPLVSSIFEIGQTAASFPLVCYLNSDIILMSDFIEAIQFVTKEKTFPFLLVGRRWDVEITEYLNFNSEWEKELKGLVERRGKLCPPNAIDYFVFSKGLYTDFLPFAVGRIKWDNWLIYHTLSRKIPVIDLTPVNIVVHQTHGYLHITQKGFTLKDNPEVKYSEQSMGCWPRFSYTIWDSTHVLTRDGIRKASIFRRCDSLIERLMGYMEFGLKSFYPYSYPIHILGRGIKFITIKFIRDLLHQRIGRYRSS